MAYATIFHVQARNPNRTFSATSKPNVPTQVTLYIDEAAGMMDLALSKGGYSPPIEMGGSTPSTVQQLLEKINADGAAYMVEAAAQSSVRRDEFQQMWEAGLKMLEAGELPSISGGAGQGIPRSATSGTATPIFTIDMEL